MERWEWEIEKAPHTHTLSLSLSLSLSLGVGVGVQRRKGESPLLKPTPNIIEMPSLDISHADGPVRTPRTGPRMFSPRTFADGPVCLPTDQS